MLPHPAPSPPPWHHPRIAELPYPGPRRHIL
jgi:hypothetical protein